MEVKAGDLGGGWVQRSLLSVRDENRSCPCSGRQPRGMLDGKRCVL